MPLYPLDVLKPNFTKPARNVHAIHQQTRLADQNVPMVEGKTTNHALSRKRNSSLEGLQQGCLTAPSGHEPSLLQSTPNYVPVSPESLARASCDT